VLQLAQWLHPWAPSALTVAYLAVVWCLVPGGIWLVTLSIAAGLLTIASLWPATPLLAAGLLVVGYACQEAAHLVTGEKTYQSSYSRQSGRAWLFLEHTVLLLPLLLVIAARRRQSPLRILAARKAVLYNRLSAPGQRADLETIRHWALEKVPAVETSHHFWQHELTGEAKSAFDRLSTDRQLRSKLRRFFGAGYEVAPVPGMNELYITGPPQQTSSDTVFYMGHVDGPWSVFPGATLFRCMVATNPNLEVTTHFPMCGVDYHEPESYRLESGDAVAFDFNRELHYITRRVDPRTGEPRVNLKLHFVAYPAALPWYGRLLATLTTRYDIRARNLFLRTIRPSRWLQKAGALNVLAWTKLFELSSRFIGATNALYVMAAALIAWVAGDLRIFLLLTGFIHYLIYIATWQTREPIAFGCFLRNAIFFKTVSMATLFGLYALSFAGEWLSLVGVTVGFGLATYATHVLGMARTYFAAELGFRSPQRLTRFPYGVIPHPMIFGAMLGIASMLLVSEFRHDYGWLAALHLIFYAIVLGQEVLSARLRGSRHHSSSVDAPGRASSAA
jgi:hypothetical protein